MRRKLVEYFRARPFPGESGKVLRVSRYFPDGGNPGHVRFSVWNQAGRAEGVVSLDEHDAARLADFICKSASHRSVPVGIRSRLRRFTWHTNVAATEASDEPRTVGRSTYE